MEGESHFTDELGRGANLIEDGISALVALLKGKL
jgi:hypothetical protein